LNEKEGKTYDRWVAYGQVKTANMLFAVELAEKYGGKGLTAVSMHPGAIWTNLGRHIDTADEFSDLSMPVSLSFPVMIAFHALLYPIPLYVYKNTVADHS
jgi:NAD(P)-dependent dehydrogenase (short-subunit alcohol dehydrogenase family)